MDYADRMEENGHPEFQRWLRELYAARLVRPDDRELFGLEPPAQHGSPRGLAAWPGAGPAGAAARSRRRCVARSDVIGLRINRWLWRSYLCLSSSSSTCVPSALYLSWIIFVR
jgi:hypothetical protein